MHGSCALEKMKQLAKGPNEARKCTGAVTGPVGSGRCAIKYLAPGPTGTGEDMRNRINAKHERREESLFRRL